MLAQIFGATVNSSTFQTFRNAPYSVLVSEAQLTVGAALVDIVTVATPGAQNFQVWLGNRSAAGQLIRWGVNPSFGPAAGFLLRVDELVVIELTSLTLRAIADGAGRLLDVVVFRTA
jgi:hypothetical protein